MTFTFTSYLVAVSVRVSGAVTTPRSVSNRTDDELVVLVVGGKEGYVQRDGHLVAPEDLAKRQGLS